MDDISNDLTFLAQYRSEVSSFFKSTWNEDAELYVYLAQKALNINEALFAELPVSVRNNLKFKRDNFFLSQTGLILKAKQLAEYYVKNGAFPRLRVVDELALTGHDFSELIYSLEDAICEAIDQYGGIELGQKEYLRLRRALFSAVEFRPLMSDSRGLTIEKSLYARVKAKKSAHIDEWFRYALTISRSLTLAPQVENTAFTPTFRISETLYNSICAALEREQEWRSISHSKTTIWQRSSVSNSQGVQAQCLLRCHWESRLKQYCVTPFVFFGAFPEDSFTELMMDVADYLDLEGFSELSSIFMLELGDAVDSIKLQLLSTLASILAFFEFLGKGEKSALRNYSLVDNSDLDKVAQCYGFISEILPEFEKICASAETRRGLSRLIYRCVSSDAPILGRCGTNTDFGDISGYLKYAAEYCVKLEIEDVECADLRRSEDVLYAPWSDFINEKHCGLTQYLRAFPIKYDKLDMKLAALILLMQHGYVGQNVHAYKNDSLYLNVGESTIGLLYLSMSPYLPALSALECRCRKRGLSFERWAARFGRYLDRSRGTLNLESRFQNFASILYKCSYLAQDWPLESDLWLADDKTKAEQEKFNYELDAFLSQC